MKKLLELASQIMKKDDFTYKNRTMALELAVAEYIAKDISIPANKLETDLKAFYATNYKVFVMQKLSKVNEMYVIDLDQTSDLVYQMWKVRYLFVHDVNNPTIKRLATAMLMVENSYIPNDYKVVVEEYPKAFFSKYDMRESNE